MGTDMHLDASRGPDLKFKDGNGCLEGPWLSESSLCYPCAVSYTHIHAHMCTHAAVCPLRSDAGVQAQVQPSQQRCWKKLHIPWLMYRNTIPVSFQSSRREIGENIKPHVPYSEADMPER